MADFDVTAKAEVWQGGQRVATFMIEDPSTVTVNRANTSRRTTSLALTEGYLLDPPNTLVVPNSADDLFAPFGNEVVPYYGIIYDDGSIEWIQTGVFGIDEFDSLDSSADLQVTIVGSDRAAEVIRSGFIDVYVIPPSQNLGVAIQTMLQTAVVGFPWQFDFAPTTALTPLTPTVCPITSDPFTEGQAMAGINGYELFFDPVGTCVFMPVPDPRQASTIWTYSEGQASISDTFKRTLNRTAAPNYFIRDGAGSAINPPLRSNYPHGVDVDPASPTYIGGKYGRVRNYASSNLLVTQAQCDQAADAALYLRLGGFEALELNAIPKPDHDVDDVIQVTRARSGITATRYVIDSLTLGFGKTGVIDAVTRKVAA